VTILTRNTKSLGLLAIASGALALAGCVTVPDAIKGSTATPVMQFSSMKHVPNLFTAAEARFVCKVMSITNEQVQAVLEIAAMQLDLAARPILGEPSSSHLLATLKGLL